MATFGKYLGSLWMFLQVEQERLQSELARERNQDLLTSFASDYAVHFLILQKGVGEEVRLEVEWQPDMLSTSNVLLIKKKNFNMHKDLTAFKVAEMLQVLFVLVRWSTLISRTRPIQWEWPITTSTNC